MNDQRVPSHRCTTAAWEGGLAVIEVLPTAMQFDGLVQVTSLSSPFREPVATNDQRVPFHRSTSVFTSV